LISDLRIAGGDGRQQTLLQVVALIENKLARGSLIPGIPGGCGSRLLLGRAQELVTKLGVMPAGSKHEFLSYLIERLYVTAIGAIDVQHHLAQHRPGVIQQSARARRVFLPEHVAGSNLHPNFVFRQSQPLTVGDHLLEQCDRFLFLLGLFFLLLLRIGRLLSGRSR
jgi:hypothetical protein